MSIIDKFVLIMGAMGEDELYGIDIVKREPRLSRGTVYVYLDKMEEAGLIVSRKVPGQHGLPRLMYKAARSLEQCNECGGRGYFDDYASSACGGRPWRDCWSCDGTGYEGDLGDDFECAAKYQSQFDANGSPCDSAEGAP